jgi:hypothetical protein
MVSLRPLPVRVGFADKLSAIMIGVDLNVMLPLIGNVFVAINRFDGTGWLAGAAVNALVRMYKKLLCALEFSLVLTRVNAVDGADVNTGRVLRADAGFANYVNSHYAVLLPKSSYRISGELNENADSIGTAILPVHFSFATVKTPRREWGVGNVSQSNLSSPLPTPHSLLPKHSNPATTFSKIAQEFSHLFD